MSKKEKLLASAQKSLQKGQVAKAIKDYQKVVQLAPEEMRNRQKLAELYGRARRVEEAVCEYAAVAKHYADGGFFLKAIAVYKQIQKLDPAQVDIYLRLAELNEKQGLVGNALAEYRTLVAHYEKEKKYAEALSILQKMRELEPENVNVLVRIAETYAKDGLKDKAREEFDEALLLVRAQGDAGKLLRFFEVFHSFYPEDPGVKAGMAEALIETGDAEKGIALLQGLLRDQPEDHEVLMVLASGYRAAGDFENEMLTYRHLLRAAPDNLDLRAGYIRACLDGGEEGRAREEVEAFRAAFVAAGRAEALGEFCRRLGEQSPISASPTAEADEVIEDIEDIEPLEELEELESLEEIESTADLGEPTPEVAEVPATEDLEELAEIPLEFLEGMVLEEVEEEPPAPPVADEPVPEPVPEPVAVPESVEEAELDLELELELDLDEEEFGEPIAEVPLAVAAAGEPAVEEPAAVDLAADLDEAEFCLQQGLFDDAERLCRSLLEQDAGCEAAVAKLAEVESRRQAAAAEPAEPLLDLATELDGEDFAALEEEFDAFADSQKGVKTQIDVEDTESHYNLGIAYKEMGLLDEAVAEFDKAGASPDRRVACLTLKGMCFAAQGAFDAGEEAFKAGLAMNGLSDGERISLLYEMGLLYEAWGRPLEALDCFQSVADSDLFFRDAGEKVEALRRQLGLEGGGEDGSSGPKGSKDRVSYV